MSPRRHHAIAPLAALAIVTPPLDATPRPFPATFDLAALDGGNGLTILGERGMTFGRASLAGGDFNGDGIADLVLPASSEPAQLPLARAVVHIIFGRRGAEAPFPAILRLDEPGDLRVIRIVGDADEQPDGDASAVIAAAPVAMADVNADGIDDIVIGAPRVQRPAGDDEGGGFVIFGRRESPENPLPDEIHVRTIDGSNGFRLVGAGPNHRAGEKVARAGDVNGDGVDDILLAAPSANTSLTDAGICHVVFGRCAPDAFPPVLELAALDGTSGFRIEGPVAGERLAFSVGDGGDADGDRADDILLGAPLVPTFTRGHAFLVRGRTTGDTPFPPVLTAPTSGTAGIRILGDDPDDRCGSGVTAGADLNADGLADLVLGAPDADAGASNTREGEITVVYGRPGGWTAQLDLSTLPTGQGFSIAGVSPTDLVGIHSAPAGDVNLDGIDDLISGTEFGGTDDRGLAFVILGRPADDPFPPRLTIADLDGTNGFRIPGIAPGDRAGVSVGGIGDLNADGVDDVALLAWGVRDDTGERTGAASVIFGRRLGVTLCPPDLEPDGVLDIFDILAMARLTADDDPDADFTRDQQVDLFDLLAFFDLLAAGC